MDRDPESDNPVRFGPSKTLEEIWGEIKSKNTRCINDKGCWTVDKQNRAMTVEHEGEIKCLRVTSYAVRRGLEYDQVSTSIPNSGGTHTKMVVKNWCGTPRCLNPLHLIHKSASKNKKRASKVYTPSMVLSNEIKRTIREKYSNGSTQRQLAEEFGVSQPSISYIINRWKDPSFHKQ